MSFKCSSSAIDIATTAIDQIHTTASSHGRVFIVEVMGHKVGWLTLSAGVASGADIILLPEIPYDLDKVCAAIEKRHASGKKFTILAVAEGAISKEMAELKKKDRKKAMEKLLKDYPSVSYKLAADITERTGSEVRVTVPGHVQRAKLILDEEYGYMVASVNNQIVKVPLEASAGQLKMVDPEDQTVQLAKFMGISFGD